MALPEEFVRTLRLLGSDGELHLAYQDYLDLSVKMCLDFMKVRLRNFDMGLLHNLYSTWVTDATPGTRHDTVNMETVHGLSIEYDVAWVGIIPDVPGTANIIGRSEEAYSYRHLNSYVHTGFENTYRVRATEAVALLKMATDRNDKGQRTEANKRGSHITGVINAYTQFRMSRMAKIFKVRPGGWSERKTKFHTEGLAASNIAYNQFLADAFVLVYRYQKKAAPMEGDLFRYKQSLTKLVKAVSNSDYPLDGDEFSTVIRKTAFHTITNETEFPQPQLMVSLDEYEEAKLVAKPRAPVDIFKHGHMIPTGPTRKSSSREPDGPAPGAAGPPFLSLPSGAGTVPGPGATRPPVKSVWGFNDAPGGKANVARAVRWSDINLPAATAATAADDDDDDDDDDYLGEITRRTPKGLSRIARNQDGSFWGLPSIRRPKRKVVVYEEDEDEEPTIKRLKQKYQTANA